MNFYAWLAVVFGAALGGSLRWLLAESLNGEHFPYGTLFANLLGAYIIGLAMAYFMHIDVSPMFKLFLITGLLGSLTTFSSFSFESFRYLADGSYALAFGHLVVHVMGSLLMTAVGWWTYSLFFRPQ